MPRRNNQTLLIGLAVGGVAALIFVAVCGLLVVLALSKSAATTGAGSPAVATGAALDGDNGNPIINDFQANPIAAEKKWIGKPVRFWNSVGKIDRDKTGWYVSFRHCDITVYIARGEEDKFSKLAPEATIEVEAILDRFTMTGRGGIIPYLWGKEARLIAVRKG